MKTFSQAHFIEKDNFWCVVLLLLACMVKWFYLAHQGYYIIFSDELLFGYNVAEKYSLIEFMRRVLFEYTHSFGVRPFLSTFLYVLCFKLAGFHVYTAFFLGIFITSALIPLYYMIIRALFNQTIALLSSLSLLFMTNYVVQSLTAETVIMGVFFLFLSLLFAISYYRSYSSAWRLFLSGIFLSMALLCRYENIFFIPFFMAYSLLFDRKTHFCKKTVYWLICISSAIYVVVCSFKQTGDIFVVINKQLSNALSDPFFYRLDWTKAVFHTAAILFGLIPWPFWLLSIGGFLFVARKKKAKAVLILAAPCVFLAFLFYKIKTGTIDFYGNYFFPVAVFIMPLVFEFLRMAVSGIPLRAVRVFLIVTVLSLLMVIFHSDNLRWQIPEYQIGYPKEAVAITKDLAHITKGHTLYILPEVPPRLVSGSQARSMLFYLGRNPIVYSFSDRSINLRDIKTEPPFFLLVPKTIIEKEINKENRRLIRDYDSCGLYEITGL